jgi:hypothetical protein
MMCLRYRASKLLGRCLMVNCLTLVVGLVGCSNQPHTTDSNKAKEVLQNALDAWKGGKQPAELKSQNPPVYIGDSLWQGGAKLKGYTIQSDGDFFQSSVKIPVALRFNGESKTREVVYWVSTNPALSITLGE